MRRTIVFSLVGIVLMAATAWAKSYDHPRIDQTFQLLPTGDAIVDDLRTFRFDGSFSWAELHLGTTGRYGRYGLEYLGVWDADTNQPLRFERSSAGTEQVLRWYYQAENTTRRFRLRYRITGAIQRYGDVAQLYWKAVEDDHAPIRQVQITVVPPAPSPPLFKVFVHSRAAPGDLQFAGDRSRAVITQTNIPETSLVEVRAFLNPSLFPDAVLRTGQDMTSLLADERGQVGPARSPSLVERLMSYGFGVAVVLVLMLVAGYVWTYLRYGKEWGVLYDALYEHEPPRPLPPAVVPAILTQGSVQNAELAKGFAATLLEAARLGHLEIEETQHRGLLGTGLLKDTDLIYRLTAKGQAILSPMGRGELGRLLPEPAPVERALEPFEVAVLDAVFRQASSGHEVSSDQIEQWGKTFVGRKSNFLIFVERWGPQLRSWFERNFFRLDDSRSEQAKMVFIGVTIAALVIVFFVSSGIAPFATAFVGVVLIGVAAKSLSRRTPEAALEVKRWEAFRRFMSDFSAMKDAGPQLLPMWESYLVYATALGVAEHLLANLKLVAAQLSQTVPAAAWYVGARGTGGGMGMPLASLESLTKSLENFHNLSRALSSSTSTGGGFGGGGGGGGGGGSSRAG